MRSSRVWRLFGGDFCPCRETMAAGVQLETCPQLGLEGTRLRTGANWAWAGSAWVFCVASLEVFRGGGEEAAPSALQTPSLPLWEAVPMLRAAPHFSEQRLFMQRPWFSLV